MAITDTELNQMAYDANDLATALCIMLAILSDPSDERINNDERMKLRHFTNDRQAVATLAVEMLRRRDARRNGAVL